VITRREALGWWVALGAGSLVASSASAQDLGRPTDDSPSARALVLDEGPDEPVFLRAIADKTTVFVGEQVTVSVYLYYRVGYEMTERGDPKYADFLRFALLSDPGSTTPIFTSVKGRSYGARLVENAALIPLRSGTLHTGPATGRFSGRHIGARVLKASNDLVITAIEPPVEGRPEGYVVGDVGQFSIKATVSPKRIAEGGSVAVTVRVEGTGNVPTEVALPKDSPFKWLDPTRRDNVITRGGRILGSRTFEYIVRIDRAGAIPLGAVSLPYFDPVKKQYQLAKADLGTVEVDPSDRPTSHPSISNVEGKDPLSKLPRPRSSLQPFTRKDEELFPIRVLAPLLAGPLALVSLLAVGGPLVDRWRRRERRGPSPESEAKGHLGEAKKALRAHQASEAIGAAAKAIKSAMADGSSRRLEGSARAGASAPPPATLEEARRILADADVARFAGTPTQKQAEELVSTAARLIKELSR